MPSRPQCDSPISNGRDRTMTGTGTGEQVRKQMWRVKDPLLSCLSRIIVDPDRIEARYYAKSSEPAAIDSASISRAIIRETLSFSEAQPNLITALPVAIQVRAPIHT